MYDLTNLAKPSGATPANGGGIKNELILIHERDVQSFPERDEDLVSITENIVLVPGKFARTLYVTNKTVVPKQEKLAGENADCGGYKIGMEVFYPGMEKEILEWLAKHATDFAGYVLFRNASNRKVYLIGAPYYPASITTAVSEWGATAENKKGTVISIESIQNLPLAIYEGEIPLEPESPNTRLANLECSGVPLSPAFSPEVKSYAMNVPSTLANTKFTVTEGASGQTIKLDSTALVSGTESAVKTLSTGINTFAIHVTKDGVTSVYSVKITKAAS